MKITHIYHSGFLVELDKSLLLFDWYKGTLPELAADKTLYVFCSHSHPDHYSRKIWDLQSSHPKVVYILDEGIEDASSHPEARVIIVSPRKTYGILADGSLSPLTTEADTDHTISTAGESPAQASPESTDSGSSCREPVMIIRTLVSTDMGVAFYVETEEKRIYHAGDLNVWFWNDEPMEDNLASDKKCRGEMQFLADTLRSAADKSKEGSAESLLDVAFVPLDPRLEEHAPRCIEAFMQILGAKTVFPMHYWSREQETRLYLNDKRISAYTPVICFDSQKEL
jgi:L-ascorbate metabolism protein UlaG (beta-lactamase superfamily)